jgi:uncharacterized membrane protein YphA (DoxX/SURF4 family)
MRITGLGRVLFALSFALLGAFSIFFPGFAQAWPAVPRWLAWHDALATASAAILLAGGILLLVPRTAWVASLVLAIVLLVRMLLLQVPHVVAHPLIEGVWEELSESLIFVAGAWTIFSTLPRQSSAVANSGNVRSGQILFALALPAIGLSHFFYLGETAPLIPSWLPLHVPLAYFTGAAWIAAALAILSGVLARLAATLAAIMVSLFTVLVWVPMVIAAPTSRGNWSEICVSAGISGAAWAVAESLRDRSWRLVRKG